MRWVNGGYLDACSMSTGKLRKLWEWDVCEVEIDVKK